VRRSSSSRRSVGGSASDSEEGVMGSRRASNMIIDVSYEDSQPGKSSPTSSLTAAARL
jgi:hypothetical protein